MSSVACWTDPLSDYQRTRFEEGNMGLYVHRSHYGLLGTGKLGGQEFLYLTPTRYTVTTRMILH